MAKVRKRTWNNKAGNKCQTWLIDYVDNFGNRKRESGFKTKVEAEIKLSKAVTEVNNGTRLTQNDKVTFAEAAEKFMDLHAEIYCKPSTLNGYKNYLKIHLIPFFGKMKLIDMTPNRINIYIKQKMQDGLSNNTINKMLILMGSIVQKMVDEGIIFQNPVRKIKKLRLPHIEMRFLEPKEIHIVLETAQKNYPDFYPQLLTAIVTGMRRGEILGLTWDRINWQTRKIFVIQSLYKGQILSPKTHTSIRKIDMADELVRVLKRWQLECPPSEGNFVFPSPKGKISDADNLIKRRFEPLLRKSGIEKIRFHDLRHTYASILIAQNVPIKYIQHQMGHSSIQVTMDRYGHLFPEVHEQGVKALDSLFVQEIKEQFEEKITAKAI